MLKVEATLVAPNRLEVARSLEARSLLNNGHICDIKCWSSLFQVIFPIDIDDRHEMANQDEIENHKNHRPGYYKDNINPIIYGIFSK